MQLAARDQVGSVPVVLDGREIVGPSTGVATYRRNLEAAISTLGAAPALVVDTGRAGFWTRTRATRWLRSLSPARVDLRSTPCGFGAPDIFSLAQARFNRSGRLLRLRVSGSPGIAHWSYPMPMLIEGWKNVYTVHDVIPLTHPELTSIDGDRHHRLLARIVENAAGLVTVSEAARKDILDRMTLPPDFEVRCCYQAVTIGTVPPKPPLALPPEGYALACGLVEPRKNLVRLAHAWRKAECGLPLVLAGPDGWRSTAIRRELDSLGVMQIGFQSPESLRSLQKHAAALLFPSLAEGFGLPILEAMALGTPVLTSRGGATEEVAGQAAVLVDPLDIDDMAAAIRRIVADAQLRQALRAKGLARAEFFSMDRFASCVGRFHTELRQSA